MRHRGRAIQQPLGVGSLALGREMQGGKGLETLQLKPCSRHGDLQELLTRKRRTESR